VKGVSLRAFGRLQRSQRKLSTYVVAIEVVYRTLGEHSIVCQLSVLRISVKARRNLHSSSDFRSGGVLPAMMTSFAFPIRSIFNEDRYPSVTRSCQWLSALTHCRNRTFSGLHNQSKSGIDCIVGLLHFAGCHCD
jgi:hypothetical protein